MAPRRTGEVLTDWEEEARRREQADPRRRAVLQERLNRVLGKQLPILLAVVALLYAGTGTWHWIRLDPGSSRYWLVGSSFLIVVLFAAGAYRLRRSAVSPERAHPMALGILAVLVVDGVLHVGFSGDPIHSTGFMLLLVASGAFLMDLRWLRAALGLILVAWAGSLVAFAWDTPTWPHFAVGMLLATVLAGLIATLRVQGMRRLESLILELEGLIGLDGLTGIANRRAFENRLEALWARLREDRQPLALILCDLDYFKNLNDTRGHPEGDAALRQVGGILRLAVRSTDDLPARLGGEEFGILLPRTNQEQALLVAERIREATAFARIPNPGAPTGETLTMSLGLALAWPSAQLTPATLLDRADHALYRAKSGGRNQVEVEEGRKPPEPAPLGLPAEPGPPRPYLRRPDTRPPTQPVEPAPDPLDRTLPWPSEGADDPGSLPPPTDDPFWTPPAPHREDEP
jgi:diguanylate cyclase (GGDEF)-like protein